MKQLYITRKIKRTHVKALFVDPISKEFYEAYRIFNGTHLNYEKAEYEFRKLRQETEDHIELVYLKLTDVKHDSVTIRMTYDDFILYGTPVTPPPPPEPAMEATIEPEVTEKEESPDNIEELSEKEEN